MNTRRSAPLRDIALRLPPRDNIAIAKTDLPPGLVLSLEPDSQFPLRQSIPSGHKVALQEIAPGEAVYRYGQVIGHASQAILPGEYVHVHNLSVQDFYREPAFGVDAKAVSCTPEGQRRTFMGYERADGRVGARNYIAVISTVNCSAHAARQIARHFNPFGGAYDRPEQLAAYPNVDGVIALTHTLGCPLQYTLLQRTLAGAARHPNVGAYVLVGLGCESNQVSELMQGYNLAGPGLVIQELGGIRKTVQAGIAAIEALRPGVNEAQRAPQPISGLTLALQCGGSDAWSGVTAMPVPGLVADGVVRQGGAVVLAETPEIYGAEHLLTRRAASPQVGGKLL
ncbi:MAG: altronate dehydratase, partial [Delftia sp.]|nr:altronate dehydratase [Delftia sp.]